MNNTVIHIICLIVFANSLSMANEVKNPSFEEGLKGWKPYWTREPGVGTMVVDPEQAHKGKNSVCVNYSGKKDWSFESESTHAVKEGEVYEYSAWVKVLGEGNVTLGVSIIDSKGKAVDWVYGAKTSVPSEDWQEIKTRFVIPPGIVQIKARTVGSKPAKIWMDDFNLVKNEMGDALRKNGIPQILTINNSSFLVKFDTNQALLEVEDRRTGRKFRQVSQAREMMVLDASVGENEIKLSLFHLPSFLKLEGKIALEDDKPEIIFELLGEGEFSQSIYFPYPFASAPGEYLIIPMNEGISYPVDDQSLPLIRLEAYGGHGICMAFFGVTDGEKGQMAILETPDDARIQFKRDEGRLCVAPEWIPQKGKFGGVRRIRYVFFDKGGYVAMAKRYRNYSKKIGIFKTLEQKRIDNPNVDQLIGAVNIWYFGKEPLSLAREMREAGMEHVLWSSAKEPADIREINRLGYLSSRYDLYQDAMNPENFKQLKWIHPDWTSEGWPKDIVLDASGNWVHGWGVETKDGKMIDCGVLCDMKAVDYAKKRITEDLKQRPYSCRFIDTTTAAPWRECYHPDHPMTRGDCKKWRMELLRYVSETGGLVTGSETGHDAAVPYVHYFEGMLSLGHYRVPDSGRKMLQVWDEAPENVRKFQVGHEYRIPLWELVFHDCVVAQWYWGDYNNKLPALWDKRDLFNVLYGTPPMFLFDRAGWEKNKARFIQSYKNTCPYVRKVGYSEMTDHRFLVPDRSVQQTVFANGLIITVNFGGQPFNMPKGGVLAPHSFHVDETP